MSAEKDLDDVNAGTWPEKESQSEKISTVKEPETSETFENLAASSSTYSESSKISVDKQDKLQALCTDAFSKMSSYLQGEMDSSIEDYSLLEKMNLSTVEKYQAMHQMAKGVGDNLHLLNQKFSDLQPYLDQIEKIESDVLVLEQCAYKLDMYSKHLEDKFKQLSKR